MTDTYAQALLDAIVAQRDAALNDLARAIAENAELKRQLAEKLPEIDHGVTA